MFIAGIYCRCLCFGKAYNSAVARCLCVNDAFKNSPCFFNHPYVFPCRGHTEKKFHLARAKLRDGNVEVGYYVLIYGQDVVLKPALGLLSSRASPTFILVLRRKV